MSPSTSPSRCRKVLVANRGEIARRILRTLREMGIPSVAVHSDADQESPHLDEADESVRIGPAPAERSYLDQEAILEAARVTGADAIHPGYGFLAEHPAFAERCAETGLVFVGPSPEAIRRMGDKVTARSVAAAVGVPVVPGAEVEGRSEEAIRKAASLLGYPLLVKAAAGGGGRGMRVVSEEADLGASLIGARREAGAAFADGRLFLERLLDRPRHVEIQILGDAHGTIVSCFERECSVQRRHQKVIEEAPSPAVDSELRRRLGEAAVAVAREVGYEGAGTVEFLLDREGRFFFLEMNTRLQVEHPVTEAVTGLDLVRCQIEIARGRPLGFGQADLALVGHAIEARLYAEDPRHELAPRAGVVSLWHAPARPGLRVDSGVGAGSEVGVHYDPLLAKVVGHGPTREAALETVRGGLAELAVGGLPTNLDLLLTVLDHPTFRAGEWDTTRLEQGMRSDEWTRSPAPGVAARHAVAATLALWEERRREPDRVLASLPSGWRNNRWRPQEERFDRGGEVTTVRYLVGSDGRFEVEIEIEGGGEREMLVARLLARQGELVTVRIGPVRRRYRFARRGSRVTVHGEGRVSELRRISRFPPPSVDAVLGGSIAPMTGKVVEVLVARGEKVVAGDPLVVVEAMKMEHRVRAATAGVVAEVRVDVGQMVDPDEVLVVVTPGSP